MSWKFFCLQFSPGRVGFGQDGLDIRLLFLVHLELLGDIVSKHSGWPLDLELDLLESLDLILVQNLGQFTFGCLLEFLHRLANSSQMPGPARRRPLAVPGTGPPAAAGQDRPARPGAARRRPGADNPGCSRPRPGHCRAPSREHRRWDQIALLAARSACACWAACALAMSVCWRSCWNTSPRFLF